MWCQNSLHPVEKMQLVATKFLVGLVWDMTTMSVMSSKTVKYKHASGLIVCCTLYLTESLCPSFTSRIFNVQCIAVFNWM